MISSSEIELIESSRLWEAVERSGDQTFDQAVDACAFSWCHARQVSDGVSLDPMEVALEIRSRLDAGA